MIYICDAIEHLKEDKEVSPEMKYQIYFYRSGIHIMVKNYGYAIEDLNQCTSILDKDEAHLKIAECYLAMEEHQKAKKIIEQRIKAKSIISNENSIKKDSNENVYVNSNNQETDIDENIINKKTTNSKIVTKEDPFDVFSKFNQNLEKIKIVEVEKQKKIQNMEIFKNMKFEEKSKLTKILTDKGIKLKQQFHKIPLNYEATIYLDQENIIHFPVLIVYEEFNTTDYLRDVEENSLISDVLDILFEENLPADKEKKYNINTVKCYLEMSEIDPILKKETNTYFPLRSDESLIDILKHSKVHMNGIPVIFIISQLTKFYTHFLKTKIILNRKSKAVL